MRSIRPEGARAHDEVQRRTCRPRRSAGPPRVRATRPGARAAPTMNTWNGRIHVSRQRAEPVLQLVEHPAPQRPRSAPAAGQRAPSRCERAGSISLACSKSRARAPVRVSRVHGCGAVRLPTAVGPPTDAPSPGPTARAPPLLRARTVPRAKPRVGRSYSSSMARRTSAGGVEGVRVGVHREVAIEQGAVEVQVRARLAARAGRPWSRRGASRAQAIEARQTRDTEATTAGAERAADRVAAERQRQAAGRLGPRLRRGRTTRAKPSRS